MSSRHLSPSASALDMAVSGDRTLIRRLSEAGIDRSLVYRYRQGTASPSAAKAAVIEEVTAGLVRANQWRAEVSP